MRSASAQVLRVPGSGESLHRAVLRLRRWIVRLAARNGHPFRLAAPLRGVVVLRAAKAALAAGAPPRSWTAASLRGVVVTLWRDSVAGSAAARALRSLRGGVGRALGRLVRRSGGCGSGRGALFVSPPGRLLRVGQARVLRSGRRA